MENKEQLFGDCFKVWYHETQEIKQEELPAYYDRTPESEIKSKLGCCFIIVIAIAVATYFIFC